MSSTSDGIQTVGTDRTATADARATNARSHPTHRTRAICTTAWATTATAATFNPATIPEGTTTPLPTARPAPMSRTADGSVKPSHARSEPPMPARRSPTPIPTCELAGPGQELGQRHEIGVLRLPQPPASLDELRAEEPQVRHGAAEGGHAQSQEGPADP